MLKPLAAAALFLFATIVPGAARDLTAEESEALEAKVVAHEAALHSKNPAPVLDAYPPGVFAFVAQMMSVDEAELRSQAIATMTEQAEGVSFDAYDIDLEAAPAPYELPDGTTYVLLPTTMLVLPGDGTQTQRQVTVAILIEGEWYLIGFSTPEESQMLSAVYPGFADPAFITNLAAVLAL